MLIIDSREGDRSKLFGRVADLCDKMGVAWEKRWIEVGDYVFGDMCFEAKSSVDFLASVMNKRIWNQIDNMDRNYKHNFVIVYGSITEAIATVLENSKTKMSPQGRALVMNNKFIGAIASISLDTDTQIMWLEDENQAAQIIASFCKVKPLNRKIPSPEIIKRVATDDLRVDVLCTIKGISNKKAKLLLKEFCSIQEIGMHSKEDLMKIEGIGEKTASMLLDVLYHERKVKI